MSVDDDLARWMHRLPLAERIGLQRADEMADGFRYRRQNAGRRREERHPCTVPGCACPARSRGLCEMHYRREYRAANGVTAK